MASNDTTEGKTIGDVGLEHSATDKSIPVTDVNDLSSDPHRSGNESQEASEKVDVLKSCVDEQATEVPMNTSDDNDNDEVKIHGNHSSGLRSSLHTTEKLDTMSTRPAENNAISPSCTSTSSQVTLIDKDFGESHTYSCVCGMKFLKSTDLAAHKRWTCKSAEKRTQCDICKSWFAHEQGLQRHMKHSHHGVFPCDSCNLRFHNKMRLTRHWMEAHYDESQFPKRLKCYICNADKFNSKYDLECHLLAHKYERQKSGIPSVTKETLGIQSQPKSFASATSPNIPAVSSATPPFFSQWRHHLHPNHSHRPMGHHHHHHQPPHFDGHRSFGLRPPHGHPPGMPLTADHAFMTFPPPPPPPSPPPPPPHHNHEIPPYPPVHSYPCMKKFMKHHHKMKMKHYVKTLMTQGMFSSFAGRPWPFHSGPHEHYDNLARTDKDKNVMDESRTMTCKFCNRTIRTENAVRHKRHRCPVLCVHKCDVCERSFSSEQILLHHMKKRGHSKPCDSYGVKIGSQGDPNSISGLQDKLQSVLRFKKVSPMSGDKQNLNEDSSKPLEIESVSNSSFTDASTVYISQCQTYSKDDQGSLQTHKCTENSIIDCEKNEDFLVIDEDVLSSTTTTFQCKVCHCTLKTRDNLEQHLRDHLAHVESIQKVQEWKVRSAEFFSGASEVDSTTSVGTSLDLSSMYSTLSECDKSSNISSHVSSINTTDKWLKPHGKHGHSEKKRRIFPCEACDEKFAFHKDLKYHMKEKHKDHTLECPICHKKFSWKSKAKFYERHLNSHYGVSVYKYKCEACDKTFLENHKFQAHMKSKHKFNLLHTCGTCGKGYGNKSSLIRHQRKHTGDKPHKCTVCNESFLEKRELIRHSASHTGASPFVCTSCGQGFTLKTSLMKHVKRKHP